MQLLNNTNIDFISKTKVTFFISLAIILLGIGSLVIKKGPNLSIDFVGGTVIQVATSKEVNIKMKDEDNDIEEQTTNLERKHIIYDSDMDVNFITKKI